MLPKVCPKCGGAYDIDDYTCPTCHVKLERRDTAGKNPTFKRWAWPHRYYFISEIGLAILGSIFIQPLFKALWSDYYGELTQTGHYISSTLIVIVLLSILEFGRKQLKVRNKTKYGPSRFRR
jgi:hypothetical protein